MKSYITGDDRWKRRDGKRRVELTVREIYLILGEFGLSILDGVGL